MLELYIVRHGQTETNHQNRVNGITNLSLNENGRNQVKNLKNNFDTSEIDEIYSSPLKRALETAQILNSGSKTIQTDNRICEINYGSWDGLTVEETKSLHPDGYDENNLISEKYIQYTNNGESFESVFNRVDDFLSFILKKKNEKIMIVCHAFVARAILKVALDIPNIVNILESDNAGVTKIVISDSLTPYLAYYNRTFNIN